MVVLKPSNSPDGTGLRKAVPVVTFTETQVDVFLPTNVLDLRT